MRLLAGTSGYSYKEWKGPFYPDDLACEFLSIAERTGERKPPVPARPRDRRREAG